LSDPEPEPARARARRLGLALVLIILVALLGPRLRDLRAPAPGVLRANVEDLVLSVEVEGELAAMRAVELGPPAVEDTEFKISFLARESQRVRRGEPVLAFDTQALERRLQLEASNLREAEQRLRQRRLELDAQRAELEAQLAQARGELGKARLKAQAPPELLARVELEQARLDVRSREGEVADLEAQLRSAQASGTADLETQALRRQRAGQRVAELRRALAAMTVRAPLDGVVVYKTGWSDEKKEVGDTVWAQQSVLELPDLSELKALGDVDEADGGQVAVGQRVMLRLESREDVDYFGRVRSVGRSVRRKSWRVPNKVYRIEIALERSDASVMRPAMRFRGRIETGRVERALVVPREAVFLRARGPVAFVRRAGTWRETILRLGRGNERHIEVLAGLTPGDVLAGQDPYEGGGAP
jgi:HlyD family secretion protein